MYKKLGFSYLPFIKQFIQSVQVNTKPDLFVLPELARAVNKSEDSVKLQESQSVSVAI